jgi:hypothetical protein
MTHGQSPTRPILFLLVVILEASSARIKRLRFSQASRRYCSRESGQAGISGKCPKMHEETFGTAGFRRNGDEADGFTKWLGQTTMENDRMTNQNNQSGQGNQPQKHQNQPQSGQQSGQQQRQSGQQNQSGQQGQQPGQQSGKSGQQGMDKDNQGSKQR